MARDRLENQRMLGLAWIVVGLLPLSVASAQVAPGPGEPPVSDADPGSDLNARYRFIEEYTTEEGRDAGGAIGQYRVAFKETIDASFDRVNAAPERTHFVRRAIYSECPAEVSTTNAGRVLSVVRHYETVRQEPNPRPGPSEPKHLDDLTIWYQNRTGTLPLVLSLSPDRPLRYEEYRFATSHLFVPNLTALLPSLPSRVGDTWPIPTEAAQLLVGDLTRDSDLVGKLKQVRADPKEPSHWLAVISVTGRVMAIGGDMGVNAQLQFGFVPPPAGDRGGDGDAPIEARGAVLRISLAQAASGGASKPDDRLRRTTRRELILERNLVETGTSLVVPKPPPVETHANGWLTYVAPKDQFRFRFPQELQPIPSPDPNTLKLVHQRDEGDDLVAIRLVPKSGLTTDEAFKRLFADWAAQKLEVQRGPTQSLNWPGMRVQSIEAVLKQGGQVPQNQERIHFDGFVIQTGRNASFAIEATTAQDPPTPFRKEIEEMIRSFAFGQPPPGAEAKGESGATNGEEARPPTRDR